MSEEQVKPARPTSTRRRAFERDVRSYARAAAAKAIWWGAAGVLARTLAKSGEAAPPEFRATSEPPPAGFVRRAWLQAFEKEAADVAAGLYPAMDDRPADPVVALRRAADVIADAIEVEARRRIAPAVPANSASTWAS